MNFNFGGDAAKPGGFSLPTATPTPAAPILGAPAISSLAPTNAPPTAAAGPFSLGGGDPGAASKPSQPQLSIPAGFSFGTAPKLSLTTSATTSIAASTSTTTTTAAPSFGIGGGLSFALPTTTTATTTSAPALALTSAPSLAPATTAQATLGTATTVTSSSAAQSASPLTFFQLEEAINKWTLELEEQEKLFMNQAAQVNAWDRLLIGNGEKIINLNNSVEQVKLEQQQLDHELDFILAQQRELEDLLTPLEKELETNDVTDPEREHTYKLAENIDTQLKQMSEDLKEIVEHINETNRSQDNTDPIVQIGRILNAHMNSLQWIDQNTSLIGSHLDQVAKLHEVHRRENERSFHLTYD